MGGGATNKWEVVDFTPPLIGGTQTKLGTETVPLGAQFDCSQYGALRTMYGFLRKEMVPFVAIVPHGYHLGTLFSLSV